MKHRRPPTARQLTRHSSEMEGVRAGDEDRTKTMAARACRVCDTRLLEHDSFCRWCGARQTIDLGTNGGSHIRITSLHQIPSGDQMRSPICPYHPVSGPLVRAIADNVSANLTSQRRERVVRRVIQALVSIPIWLVFVLLSPFDAYAAAKSVTTGEWSPRIGTSPSGPNTL